MATQTLRCPTQLRSIALSRISVPDGFNPRGQVAEDPHLDALAQTMRTHGCLQPIRVREDGHGDCVLIAGERRYRAAARASLTDLPAIVRPAGEPDDDPADLLVEAVIENDQRSDLDPLSRARAYDRLREHGLTVKGIAERLGVAQARVRERLALLELPQDLHTRVSSGEIPQHVTKALVSLAKIHPALASIAVGCVLDVDETQVEPSTCEKRSHLHSSVRARTGSARRAHGSLARAAGRVSSSCASGPTTRRTALAGAPAR